MAHVVSSPRAVWTEGPGQGPFGKIYFIISIIPKRPKIFEYNNQFAVCFRSTKCF